VIILAREKKPAAKLDQYLTVAEAADFLGVSASTLRNWDRTGKLKPSRNPLNRYRLYRRDDLASILRAINTRWSGQGR
jgi:excisionase family DNA binding protein